MYPRKVKINQYSLHTKSFKEKKGLSPKELTIFLTVTILENLWWFLKLSKNKLIFVAVNVLLESGYET